MSQYLQMSRFFIYYFKTVFHIYVKIRYTNINNGNHTHNYGNYRLRHSNLSNILKYRGLNRYFEYKYNNKLVI